MMMMRRYVSGCVLVGVTMFVCLVFAIRLMWRFSLVQKSGAVASTAMLHGGLVEAVAYMIARVTHSVIMPRCLVVVQMVAVTLVILSSRTLPAQATLELGSPFVDDMILQREMPVPIWGWAPAGTEVTVAFAGQERSAAAGPKGRWQVMLAPLAASAEERDLVVTTPTESRITRRGVLVGEVWFSSGQSNMDWVAGKSMCRDLANRLQRAKPETPIREYAVDIGASVFLRDRAASKEGWKRARRAGSFSALSLAFAHELHEALGVPVGILRSTHGATPVETWTAYEGFAARPALAEITDRVRSSDPTTDMGKLAYARFYDELRQWRKASAAQIERGGKALPQPRLPGIGADWKGPTRMYNHKIAPLVPYAIRGVIWCQGTHNANDGEIYAEKMHALVDGLRANWARPDLPFYFTQMQCYGAPDPDNVGFADIREAQRKFFMTAKNVGMVLQHDLNPSRPAGIHYFNKLDPGKRLARWALAHQYDRDLAYSGPLYSGHSIVGDTVRVQFEQRGPGGGLMVGSKGLEADSKKSPDAYVEPARPTPGEPLQHFRLAGKDGVWHAAEAVIDGDEVVVRSAAVRSPLGVQYAYSAVPMGANLYNRAGLPATPFAVFAGKPLFQADLKLAAKPAETKVEPKPYIQLATLFRPRSVVQRDRAVPIWGFARPGVEVTVRFAGQTKKATVDEFERWRVDLDPMSASASGRDLVATTSDGASRTVPDVVVGDLWVLTGTAKLASEMLVSKADAAVEPLPLVREFRIKTKARRFREPRKRRMEIGGGRYESSWQAMTFDGERPQASAAGYAFAKQVQQEGIPVGVVTLGAENPPLTWVSYAALQTAKGFEADRDELNQLFPNTDAGSRAVDRYIEMLQGYNRQVATMLSAGDILPDELAAGPPGFPQPAYDQWSPRTENATLTYNFCISPLSPAAISGLVWIPGPQNIGTEPARYGAALTVFAESLAATWGLPAVSFFYAQPKAGLVEGLDAPSISTPAEVVEFGAWPKSMRELAEQLGRRARAGAR